MGFQPRVALACVAVRRAGLPDGFDPLKVRSSFDAVQNRVLWEPTGGGEGLWGAAAEGGAGTQLPGADAATSRLSRILVTGGKERRSAGRLAHRASSGSHTVLAVTTVLQRLAYWVHVCSTASMLRVYLPAAWGD